MSKEETDQESPCQYLLPSTKQEFYIIGRLHQIQNFSKILLLEMLYGEVDAEQNTVMPLADGPQNLGAHLTLLQPGGQIMPTTLLLVHPDLKTERHLCVHVCTRL